MVALVLFVAIMPIPLSSSSEMPRTAALSKRAPVAKSAVAAAYGKLPLSFEINKGQTDRRVRFLSRGNGYSLFLTGNEAVLTLHKGSPPPNFASNEEGFRSTLSGKLQSAVLMQSTAAVLRMKLAGGNAKARITGVEELTGKSNYFIGKDPSKWRTSVPNYAKVKYANVYPGVDLVYYGNQRQLEYDFVVQPGADPRQIELGFDGARRLRLDAGGNLIVSIAGGEVIEHKPVIYQDIGGMRRQVAGSYELRNSQRIGFKLTSYDAHRILTIDPSLVYSTYLGGSGFDQGEGIALDSLGNAYVTGNTISANFPTTVGAFQTTLGSTTHEVAFVSKLNSSGSALLYSTYLGGSGGDGGFAIELDSAGDAYVTGDTASTDFPVTAGAFQTTFGGGEYNAFISKLNSRGSALIYSTYLGGTGGDVGEGISLDSLDNAYVTGDTTSTDFPTTAGAFQVVPNGYENAFVSKLNSRGSALIYSTYLGGSEFNQGLAIALDSLGNAYVTGDTTSTDFPTTAGAFQTVLNGFQNAFVTKLNSSGSALIYSTYFGGRGSDYGNAIALDSAGDAYVTGQTSSTNFPTTAGAFQTTYGGGGSDVFASELNSTSSGLIYSTYLGSIHDESGSAIALDSANNVYLTGTTDSPNFPTTAGAFQTTYGGGRFDVFVSKLAFATFSGQPGAPNCHGQSVSALSNQFGTIDAAALALGFPSVQALQTAIREFCA